MERLSHSMQRLAHIQREREILTRDKRRNIRRRFGDSNLVRPRRKSLHHDLLPSEKILTFVDSRGVLFGESEGYVTGDELIADLNTQVDCSKEGELELVVDVKLLSLQE